MANDVFPQHTTNRKTRESSYTWRHFSGRLYLVEIVRVLSAATSGNTTGRPVSNFLSSQHPTVYWSRDVHPESALSGRQEAENQPCMPRHEASIICTSRGHSILRFGRKTKRTKCFKIEKVNYWPISRQYYTTCHPQNSSTWLMWI